MILATSILSADFGRLADEVRLAEKGGAGAVHVDVMDGHFVPNLTVGPAVVKAVRKATDLPIDVHLMIENAERYVDVFVDAGANWVSLHVEAMPHLQRTVAHLRARGIKTAAAVNPGTSLTVLDKILPDLDYVLVMSVNPGFSGQAFIPSSVDKVRRLRAQLTRLGLPLRIEVDGGVDRGNIRALLDAGADILVAGNAVFAGGDPERAARGLVEAAR